jgi:hypothetical protein
MIVPRRIRELWPIGLGQLLLLWLIVGLPVLGYGQVRPALANHIALAMALGVLVVLATVLRAATITCGVLGAWLAASPWLIGYASTTMSGARNDVLSGLALICLSALQHHRAGQHPLAAFPPTEHNAVS